VEWYWQEIRDIRGKVCPISPFSPKNATKTSLEQNPYLRGEKPAIKNVSSGSG
jgi:hypothetical protein